jgi:hypothetical protein
VLGAAYRRVGVTHSPAGSCSVTLGTGLELMSAVEVLYVILVTLAIIGADSSCPYACLKSSYSCDMFTSPRGSEVLQIIVCLSKTHCSPYKFKIAGLVKKSTIWGTFGPKFPFFFLLVYGHLRRAGGVAGL